VTPKHKSHIYPWKLTKTESIPQAHRATAFHFLISNRLGRLATAAELALALVPSPDGPGKISISSDAITSHYSQLPHFPPYPPTPEHWERGNRKQKENKKTKDFASPDAREEL
jgi:hypothetical protein